MAVSIIDVSSDTRANYGVQDTFEAASTMKVLSAVLFLHQVEDGTQSLSGSFDDTSAQLQLREMINRSNNNSWAIINKQIGYRQLVAYAKSIGLNSYDANKNLISAHDAASLLSQLYQGKLLNEKDTKLLLSLMQKTNNEQMIPMAIPQGAIIYHKYGLLENKLHDIAIVEYHNRPIVLTIYTKSVDGVAMNYSDRIAFIRQLANIAFTNFYGIP